MQDRYEKICYKKNYIKEVICRFDFATPISIFNQTMPKNIFDVLKIDFPIAEPQDVVATNYFSNSLNIPFANQMISSKKWCFFSRNRKNRCTITTDTIVFSIEHYNRFEEARNSFIDIIAAILNTNLNIQGKRFGLRYRNNIPLDKHENWIDSKFYTALSAHKNEETTRLLTTFEYALKENDLKVRLSYGYDNPDYPAIIKKDDFIIDIDAYNQGLIYKEDLSIFIDNMHFEVQKCFEDMITDEFRTELDK